MPDPRRRRGTRHRAAVVLAFSVAAVIAGADSVTAIAEWARDLAAEEAAALGARRDRKGRPAPPSLSTFRRVLRRLDGEAVAAAFGAWLAAQVLAGLADASSLLIALDGKTVRGARAGDGKAPHLLAAMITGARAVVAQKDVDAKTNEITQVRPLLADLGIKGALVTADALHVQKDTARYLVEEKKADYLFTAVKENQPGLFAALDALAWKDAPVAHVMEDKGHGRHETRTIQVLPAPDGCFPYAAQAVLVERLVRDPRDGRLRSAAGPRHHQPGPGARRHAGGARPRRARSLGHRGPPPRPRRHHEGRRQQASLRDIPAGRSGDPEHRHRSAPARRVHQHCRRATLGREKPGQAIGDLESHITRMTSALGQERRKRGRP